MSVFAEERLTAIADLADGIRNPQASRERVRDAERALSLAAIDLARTVAAWKPVVAAAVEFCRISGWSPVSAADLAATVKSLRLEDRP